MQYKNLGQTDIKISEIVFGCWQTAWPGVDEEQILKSHTAAFDTGITTFDTAIAYGNGQSEQMLARAVSSFRDKVVIATKISPNKLTAHDVVKSCETSLKNLDTDRIDLYQIHWPAGSFGSPVVPLSETLPALAKLREEGKIRAIGVSNFSPEQIKEALSYTRIESIQPPYSLFWRSSADKILPICEKHTLSLLAYSPLAQGLLTGKFTKDSTFPKHDPRGNNRLFKGDDFDRALAAVEQLRRIAAAKETTVGNIALAWLVRQSPVAAIVGASKPEQASQNAQASDIILTAEEIAEIDKIGRSVTDHLDDNPVMWQ